MKSMADRLAGALTVLAGCLALREAWKLYPYHVSLLGGDHVFPAFIGAGLLLCGLWLLAASRGQAHKALVGRNPEEVLARKAAMDEPEVRAAPPLLRRSWPKAGLIPPLLLIYTVLLQSVGYALSTFVASLLLLRLLGGGWRRSGLYALVLTSGLFLVFIEWLHTPFPAGTVWHALRRQ
ncbi:tripartite tricarboxylate transporter TctB family protein [Paenibacillus sp. S150]|uniref:tripartite tricarboxylate transporter TctB family protein n=1 Tax=Paenibacillus sp. S150 TaxID=2749826 RepID=UPI001C55A76E|nr:tripartite tricarboxylate transporter TctB family protein [Paenibacillus sp. S150]MBW4081028.1 tripartite tricarboxylate transporter TctB family protein [Paenibacillus sp. S150]